MPKKQTEWSRSFNEKAYDRLSVTIPKGRKGTVEEHAKRKGTSVNGLINDLLRAELGMLDSEWRSKGEFFLTEIPEYDGVGVYALESESGAMYIGSSKNIKKRLLQHETFALRGTEPKKIQEAINAGERFTVKILEKMSPSTTYFQLMDAEYSYISEYAKTKTLYNTTLKPHLGRGDRYSYRLKPLRPDLIERTESL